MTVETVYTFVAGVIVAVASVSAGHALLSKRDPRAALGWIAVCVLFPLLGPSLYFMLGINRVRTRAQKLAPERAAVTAAGRESDSASGQPASPSASVLERVGRAVSRASLRPGNAVELLHDGERAFPSMLDAIAKAREEVLLATYIFESNATGERFVDALSDAIGRGVTVRVLVDGVGELYSWPRVTRRLRKRSVPVQRFLPPRLLPPRLQLNLRNHRKLLVVDGTIAFTGGMNIGDRHLVADAGNKHPVVDVHAKVRGPVVADLRRVFVEDWRWVSGETLVDSSVDTSVPAGAACARVVSDGPSDELERISVLMEAAAALATRRLRIMTPYFLPPRGLIASLQIAALRGVEVEVVLPEHNNLPYVYWATRKMLWEILGRGVRVYLQSGPFVHTKLLAVDDEYVLLGSANVDPRSLRLNFELVLEVYDAGLAREVSAHFDAAIARSREVTLLEMETRPILVKIRDALAWLASPYL
jgi:cardiolipin synthase